MMRMINFFFAVTVADRSNLRNLIKTMLRFNRNCGGYVGSDS